MAVDPGEAAHRVTGDRGGAAVELLEIMVDQILETRLHATIIFARDEDEGIGSGQALRQLRHGGRRLASRIVAVAQVEHRQVDRLGIDQFRLVAQPFKAPDQIIRQPYAETAAPIGAVEDEDIECHAEPPAWMSRDLSHPVPIGSSRRSNLSIFHDTKLHFTWRNAIIASMIDTGGCG